MLKRNLYIAELKGNLEEAKAKAIERRIRKKYSVSDELAILRQRDTKPEEFAEYNAYCEKVKADVQTKYVAQKEKYSKLILDITEDGRIIYASQE